VKGPRELTMAVTAEKVVWRGSRAFGRLVLLIVIFTCLGVAQAPSRIQNLVSAGTLEGMRWPNFSDRTVVRAAERNDIPGR
jgi:hypothetical protein